VTATLRVVLDQVVAPVDRVLAEASAELARALVATAPSGCEVAGLVPSVPKGSASDVLASALPGLASSQVLPLGRRELAGAWQLGVAPGAGGGMIHSPSLFAPLVKHDRVHDMDQTVVTVWDLRAWEAPDELSRGAAAWQKGMLRRAARHADAVVVPTHAMAERLSETARLGDRVRVIAGAAPAGFSVPTDEIGRRRELDLPEGYVVLSGGVAASDALSAGFEAVVRSGLDVPVVVLDAPEGEEPAIVELASAAGIPQRLVHVRGVLDGADRGAVLGAAVALLAPAVRSAWPWRVVDALTLGVPVVAAESPVHREVLWDGGMLVEPGDLGQALASVLSSATAVEKASVLSGDRGRAFSWHGAAERVWTLHADL
jgi:hypothetical protein